MDADEECQEMTINKLWTDIKNDLFTNGGLMEVAF